MTLRSTNGFIKLFVFFSFFGNKFLTKTLDPIVTCVGTRFSVKLNENGIWKDNLLHFYIFDKHIRKNVLTEKKQ